MNNKSIKQLHKRNIHNKNYDFELLIKLEANLKKYLYKNKYGDISLDFTNPYAIKLLNSALLKTYYDIQYWDIPDGYLSPPIPSRVDYIHHIADLLKNSLNDTIPIGKSIKALDIGVGANCIYPIVGHKSYGWSFVGTEIDPISIKNIQNIITKNKLPLEIIYQKDKHSIFDGIIKDGDKFDFTICNPPFFSSEKDALKEQVKKIENLSNIKIDNPTLNFQGKSNELWCKGGELAFIKKMIKQSTHYKTNVKWFTTLVSKKDNLKTIYKTLKSQKAKNIKTIEMKHGNKQTRFIAWNFWD
ncbi:MAG: 23S rRNA (adenine(1618)-N(6))-methyltransferase RlmF [Campylobacterota bacterium]|nr:23S rRNA (adenine(1618)-N(6))-methyltransferase RlmF [Campylobacterota bacterium]